MRPDQAPSYDVVAVLGCGVESDGRPSPALRRRLALAIKAHQWRPTAQLLLTGGKRYPGGFIEAEVMREHLGGQGIVCPLILETRSLSTRENAAFSARLLDGAPKVLLATCSWHLPRAVGCFRRHGVDAVPPPRSWWNTPPPSPAAIGREAMSRCLDWTLTRLDR